MTFAHFRNLELENFMSIGMKQRIPLAKQGLTLIEGRNGSGKSTIIDGFFWTLFGKPLRKLGSVDKIVNRWTGKDCSGTLTFKVGSTDFELSRYRSHHKHKNKVYLLADGKDITRKDVVDEQVVEILGGLDYKIAARTLVFSKRDLVSFASLPDSEQKAVFEKLLGIEELNTACQRAQELARAQHKEAEALMTEIAGFATVQAVLNETVASLRKSRAAFEEQKKEQIEECFRQLKEARSEVPVYAHLKDRIVKEDYQLQKLAKQQQDAASKLEDLRDKVQEASDRRNVAQLAKATMDSTVRDLEERFDPLFEMDTCPTCDEVVPKAKKESWRGNLVRMQKDLATATERFHAAHKEWEQAGMHARVAEKAAEALTVALHPLRSKLAMSRAELAACREQKQAVRERLAALERRLDKVQAQTWSQAEDLVKAKQRVSEAAAKRQVQEKRLKVLTHRVKYTEFWVEGFGRAGLPTDLIDTVLPVLTQRTQSYLNRVSGGSMAVSFDTQKRLGSGETRDKFTVLVDNAEGADSYGGNSVGELAKVDFCIALAMQDLAAMRAKSSTNVAFFDETFDGTDAIATDAIMELLTDISRTKESIFVISHLDALKSSFPRVLSVERDDKRFTKVGYT